MGKKGKGKSGGELGRALLKDRFGPARSRHRSKDPSMLHTADINDGYDWSTKLTSVTEQDSMNEFLATAQLKGTDFQAEKLNIRYVNPQSRIGLLSDDERKNLQEQHRLKQDLLKIPRRPKWDATTSAYQLKINEDQAFAQWRAELNILQEVQNLTLTPYEKNLEFWRQLWRVVERSDVIIQIVDARNPLLFRCEDLEKYVKEVDKDKTNLILINKADFLTDEQRQAWANYFTEIDVQVAFFSALDPTEEDNKIEEEEEDEEEVDDDESEDDESSYASGASSESEYASAEENLHEEEKEEEKNNTDDKHVENLTDEKVLKEDTLTEEISKKIDELKPFEHNSPEILSRIRLIEFFKSMGVNRKTYTPGLTTIGLVGYPNVGKSSTINAIFTEKKVSVSATPGKTKHFQTLFVDKELLLCDCPGLVMPSFVCTKAEMVLNGILPIDQLRDHVPSVTLLGTLIPRHILEDTYGIMLPLPMDGEDPNRPPTSEEILNTWGYNRGFMTQNGQPDNPRSARYVLKDFVNGKLLYAVAPPNKDQNEYHTFPPRRKIISENHILPPRQIRANRGVRYTNEDLDQNFFHANNSGVHIRGGLPGKMKIAGTDLGDKPWKKMNKHNNKKKREKTRKLFAHLDQH